MKKIISVISFALFVGVLFINLDFENQDIKLKNIIVLANAQAEGGSSTQWECYSTYTSCWFWNCINIYRCGNPCESVSANYSEYPFYGTCIAY